MKHFISRQSRRADKQFRKRIAYIRAVSRLECRARSKRTIFDDCLILLPLENEDAAQRTLYRQFDVECWRGIYFTTIRQHPSGQAFPELIPYVLDDARGKTLITPNVQRLKEIALLIDSQHAATQPIQTGNPRPIVLEVQPKEVEGQDLTKTTSPNHGTPQILSESQYREGTVQEVSQNKYERNRDARRRCIEHYGCRCSVCGFDFGEVYGEIGSGFIHVHHLKPLSEIREEYVIDPIADMRPVCPNCHAMIHTGPEILTIESLKALIRRNGGQINSASLERKTGAAKG